MFARHDRPLCEEAEAVQFAFCSAVIHEMQLYRRLWSSSGREESALNAPSTAWHHIDCSHD